MGVEAAVGPHRELSPGPAVAHPPHRLTQEVGGATGGVGAALAQPGHQHLAGASGNGQQRVIAAGAGIAVVARSLLGQSIGLADGRVQVDAQGRVAGSRPQRPRPGPTTGGSRGRVDGHAPTGSCAGRSPGWMDALTTQPRTPTVHQRAAHRRRRAVAACQRGSDQCQHLVPSVRPSRRSAEVKVMVDEFPQARCRGQGGRQDRPALPPGDGRQRGCGYGRVCSVAASIGCSLFPGWFLFQNYYSRFRGAPAGFFKDCPQGRLRWIRAKTNDTAGGKGHLTKKAFECC